MKQQMTTANDGEDTFGLRSSNSNSAPTPPVRLLPSAPPPSYPMVDYTMVHPPPYNFAHHIYDAIEPKAQHKWMFRVALFEFLFGITALSISLTCAIEPGLRYYFPLFTGCWTTPFYVINAIVGIIAAKRGTANFFVAHIVFSVLSVVCSIILIVLCILNWQNAGRGKMVPNIDNNYCYFYEHEYPKLTKLNVLNGFDYEQCMFNFKLGVTFNMVLVVLGIMLGKFMISYCFSTASCT